jgi:hypothetical protein
MARSGYWLMMIGTALALVGSVGAAGFVRSDGSLYLDALMPSRRSPVIQRLAVHIGARVAPLAAPSAVIVSQTVKYLVASFGQDESGM